MTRSDKTTLCYIKRKDTDEILFIVKNRTDDPNSGKWLGIGGHFEENEAPTECMIREINEETGLTKDDFSKFSLRGLITFISDKYPTEYMHVYEAEMETLNKELIPCEEGELVWLNSSKIYELPVWEGDKIMFDALYKSQEFFEYKFEYVGDSLNKIVKY